MAAVPVMVGSVAAQAAKQNAVMVLRRLRVSVENENVEVMRNYNLRLVPLSWLKILIIALVVLSTRLSHAQLNWQILGGGYVGTKEPITYLKDIAGTICSGAVVGRKTILTARHCLSGFRGKPVYAGVGEKFYAIKKRYGGPHDLALLVTAKKISSARYRIIRNSFPVIGQILTVFGYGRPEPGVLKFTYLRVTGYESSGAFIASSIDGSAPCVGDSGGPAVVSYRGRLAVLGVVSRGQASCAIGSGTAFGATGSARGYNWITSKLKITEK